MSRRQCSGKLETVAMAATSYRGIMRQKHRSQVDSRDATDGQIDRRSTMLKAAS